MHAIAVCKLCNWPAIAEEGEEYNSCRCGAVLARRDGLVVIVRSPAWKAPEEKPFEIKVTT